jgi:NTP pyrophosphatase (non-canonical NTP hydrolase)
MYKKKVEFLCKQARKLDPYFKIVNSKKLFWEIRDELDEAIEELEKGNFKELEKELWDIFRCFLLISHKLEEENKINIEKIYEWIYKKMSSRKSFLWENREVTQKEAIEIWNDAKRKEWYPEERLWTEKRTNLD